jgi:hypothetical protein
MLKLVSLLLAPLPLLHRNRSTAAMSVAKEATKQNSVRGVRSQQQPQLPLHQYRLLLLHPSNPCAFLCLCLCRCLCRYRLKERRSLLAPRPRLVLLQTLRLQTSMQPLLPSALSLHASLQ